VPDRSRQIVVLAHCHLNVNTKVHGLADYPGARADILRPLIDEGVGIVQLPCPEATFLGMRRWGMSVEQYDTPAYRRHCREILAPVIGTLTALVEDGCVIREVLGVDGSPSCGVSGTCSGYDGGEIEQILDGAAPAQRAAVTPGRGVFTQELQAALQDAGIVGTTFTGFIETR
jgi:predicted secreted protein